MEAVGFDVRVSLYEELQKALKEMITKNILYILE
jgi:hypothetical protein